MELGVTGATVVRSEGMAKVLGPDQPVFAGLQSLRAQARPQNATVFSVIESPDTLDAALEMIETICGDLDRPGTGIAFCIPLNRVIGLAGGTSRASPPNPTDAPQAG